MEHTYLENKSHGTSFYPLQVYSHADKNGFYFVSQHWHDEMEWIYVEEGLLNIIVVVSNCKFLLGNFVLLTLENCTKSVHPKAILFTMLLFFLPSYLILHIMTSANIIS